MPTPVRSPQLPIWRRHSAVSSSAPTATDLSTSSVRQAATDGEDLLVGLGSGLIEGHGGDDTIVGRRGTADDGSDSYDDIIIGGSAAAFTSDDGYDTVIFSGQRSEYSFDWVTKTIGGIDTPGLQVAHTGWQSGTPFDGTDTLFGIDRLVFADGEFTVGQIVLGTSGIDGITGTAGDDLLDGRGGANGNTMDLVEGGAGDDTFLVSGENGNRAFLFGDTSATGGGQEAIDSTDTAIIAGSIYDYQFYREKYYSAAIDVQFLRTIVADGSTWIASMQDIDRVQFDDFVLNTSGVDNYRTAESTGTTYGVDSNDFMIGSSSDDVLVGGAGGDRLLGGAGDDVLAGGWDPKPSGDSDFGLTPNWYFQFYNLTDVVTLAGIPNANPAVTGLVDRIDVHQQGLDYATSGTAANPDDFGLRYTGYIDVDDADNYMFGVSGDDGYRLLVDGVTVVELDGLHGAVRTYGGVALSAGQHRLDVEYFEYGGGEVLDLQVSGADTGNVYTDIHDSGMLSQSHRGQLYFEFVNFNYTPSSVSQITQTSNTDLTAAGYVDDFDVGALAARYDEEQNADWFGVRWQGTIVVGEGQAGDYTFETGSDDGSGLWIDGTQVVQNDGHHGMVYQSGTIHLEEGVHDLEVRFFERSGGENMVANVTAPGAAKTSLFDSGLIGDPDENTELSSMQDEIAADPDSIDQALYHGVSTDYDISIVGTWEEAGRTRYRAVVEDRNLADGLDEGRDELIGIDELVFADRTLSLDQVFGGDVIVGSSYDSTGTTVHGDEADNYILVDDQRTAFYGHGGNDTFVSTADAFVSQQHIYGNDSSVIDTSDDLSTDTAVFRGSIFDYTYFKRFEGGLVDQSTGQSKDFLRLGNGPYGNVDLVDIEILQFDDVRLDVSALSGDIGITNSSAQYYLTAEDDILIGGAGKNDLKGSGGDDTFIGGGGNDKISGFWSTANSGGADTDTAVYLGNFADYAFDYIGGEYVNGGWAHTFYVTDLNTADGLDEGRDTLKDIDVLVFNDRTILVDDLFGTSHDDLSQRIVNGGFDYLQTSGVVAGGLLDALPGWSVTGGDVRLKAADADFGTGFFLQLDNAQTATIAQTVDLEAAKYYTLSFDFKPGDTVAGSASDEVLEVIWNGEAIGHVYQASDFAKTYHFRVQASDVGATELALSAYGPTDGRGVYLDNVSISEGVNPLDAFINRANDADPVLGADIADRYEAIAYGGLVDQDDVNAAISEILDGYADTNGDGTIDGTDTVPVADVAETLDLFLNDYLGSTISSAVGNALADGYGYADLEHRDPTCPTSSTATRPLPTRRWSSGSLTMPTSITAHSTTSL